jgi:2,4-dienoyl-CoA reductase-like NADH-dependent reductase (Old Yellow Enzyme family)
VAADSGDRAAQARLSALVFVGSAYSYLQEWLPHVGQHNVREGLCDFVGLGRIALSYPGLPADVLSGAPLRARVLPHLQRLHHRAAHGHGVRCYPLDKFYAGRPEAIQIRNVRVK